MNIAQLISIKAKENPNKVAVKAPIKRKDDGSYIYESLTFKELIYRANSIATGLEDLGLKKGDKTLVFVRPGLDFPAITFALFLKGIVPVFIDPGMGRKNLLSSIKQVRPVALIGVPEVHFLRLFFRSNFSSIKHFITTGSLKWGSMKTLSSLKKCESKESLTEINPDELAAVLFTSGGTGVPKGVEYTHKIFTTQTRMLQEMFDLGPNDVDIPGFPLFALFTMAMGMTSCIPDMNPSKPAKANPEKLVQNILDNKGTFVAGSPAIWERVALYCTKNDIQLPSVKYLVMFGAPVSADIHRMFSKILKNGTTYTPYGATESLPVANISGKELLANTVDKSKEGLGTCIGKPVKGTEVKIIQITDSAIEKENEIEEKALYELGEIIVKGDTVTKSYFEMPKKTKEAKIYTKDSLWHRIGDIGYFDDLGQIWFCGRKTHRVETKAGLMSSIQSEAVFNEHPSVKRTALVGIGELGSQRPGLVVELSDKNANKNSVKEDLLKIAKKHKHTTDIDKIWFHKSFPVDVRHNIKIDRKKLTEMAENGELR